MALATVAAAAPAAPPAPPRHPSVLTVIAADAALVEHQIKHQIERLEGLNDSMENQLVEVRHQVKQRETAIYEQAEGQLKKIYADKMRKMKEEG